MKQIHIIYIVCAAAALGAFLLFAPAKNTIVLKDDGFHPRTLTIREGETVTFRSERGKYFWPASDFHPTHKLYPAFDAKRAVSPNDSWSFTFDEAGVYKFHDHLAAYFFGVIKVADAEGNVTDDCMAHGGQFECWQNDIFIALAEKGLGAAYDEVARLYAAEPDFASSCHYIAHNIGLASYQFYRENPDAILSPKAASCAAGFYHGFMEGFLGATGDIEAAAGVCERIGGAIGDEAPDARLQCYHGIGHGAIETALATTGSFGSLSALVADAAAVCEQASDGGEQRYRCVSGIYNAIANLYINGEYGLSLDTSDPWQACKMQKEEYKEACYGNMNSLAYFANGNDFSRAEPYMLMRTEGPYQAKSTEYLSGLNAVSRVHDSSFADVVVSCHAVSSPLSLSCVDGFAQGLLEHGQPGEEYKQALAFCREPALTDAERDSCRSSVITELPGWYSLDVAREICAGLPEDERAYCAE
jgi:plastocyanin